MKSLKRLTVVAVIVALMVMMFPAAFAFAEGDTVVIFHTNDIHGRAEGTAATDKNGNPVESGSIGYARYKTILDDARNTCGEASVLVFDAGDTLHGTNFATLSQGESIVNLMGMVGIDAMVCGNHEFNYGQERLKELEGMAELAGFPILAVNILKGDNTTFFDSGSAIFNANVGTQTVKFGVVGVTTPETKVKAHPKYTEGLSFGAGENENDANALAEVVQAEINALQNDVDYVILLAHLGVDGSSDITSELLISKLKGVTLVIDGHSHTTLDNGRNVADKDGKNVLLVQAGEHFKNIGKVTLKFNDTLELTSITAELLKFKDVRDVEGDGTVQEAINDIVAQNEEYLETPIGETAVLLDGERAHVRAGETNLGNLITDAILKASGADVVLTNGGGIRASIPPIDEYGNHAPLPYTITMNDALTVLPFGNQVTVIKVTGQDIIDALAFGAKSYPNPAGGFPHVAGMTYTIHTGDDGKFSKIGEVTVGGEPIDPAKEYTLATNDFLAGGGDGYVMFGGKEQVTLLGLMVDIFVDEIKALSDEGPINIEKDGRLKIEQPQPEVPVADVPQDLNEDNNITFDGDEIVYDKSESKNMVFQVDADINTFLGVTLNGVEVDPSLYDAKPGSIIVTLLKKFFEGLVAGNSYDVGIVTTMGTAHRTIKVIKSQSSTPTEPDPESEPNAPATGESSSWVLYAGVILILLGASIVVMVLRRKRTGESDNSM